MCRLKFEDFLKECCAASALQDSFVQVLGRVNHTFACLSVAVNSEVRVPGTCRLYV